MIILIILVILLIILFFILNQIKSKSKNNTEKIFSTIEHNVEKRNPYLENKIEKVLNIKLKQENYINKLSKGV